MSKATVYAYVGNNRGVATDLEGNEKRNGWVKLNLALEQDEVIEKLSWRSDDWGSNNVVLRQSDVNALVGKVLTLCDAMIADKEQKQAWKHLVKNTIYEWHDEKFQRYNLITGVTGVEDGQAE